MKRMISTFAMTMMIGTTTLHAQTGGAGPAKEPSPFVFDVEFDWIGLGASLGFKGWRPLPPLDTVFKVIALGCYDRPGFFRLPDGAPYNGTEIGFDPALSPYAGRLVLRAALEIDQGILWSERRRANRLEAFLAYRLRYEQNFDDPAVSELLFASALPDREGLLQNSIFIGLEWNDVDRKHPHRLLSGTQAELSAEWGPGWLGNTALGRADFLRLNLSARAFLPLFDLEPGKEWNAFSAYAGFFAAVDVSRGGSLPLNVLGYFGGRTPRKGLGFAVRGLEDGRLDAPLKAVANAEVRFLLPALIDPSIVPGLVLFCDAGYYDFIDFPDRGFVFSAGAGVTLALLDALNLCFTTQFLLNRTKVTGEFWTPVYFEFIWHF